MAGGKTKKAFLQIIGRGKNKSEETGVFKSSVNELGVSRADSVKSEMLLRIKKLLDMNFSNNKKKGELRYSTVDNGPCKDVIKFSENVDDKTKVEIRKKTINFRICI